MYKIFQNYKRDNSDIITKINDYKKINCPLCENTKGYLVYESDGGIPDHKVWCKKCGLIYKNIRWTEKANNTFYNKYYLSHYFDWKFDGTEGAKTHFKYGERRAGQVKAVKDILSSAKKPIEIGCSSGGVLSELTKINPKAIGIDIDEHSINYAKKIGLNAVKLDLFKTKEKFDFVWSSHVFEHLLDIKSFIGAIEKITLKNGHLILIVPNSQKMPEGPHVPHTFNFFEKQFIQIIEENSNFRLFKTMNGVDPRNVNDIFVVFTLSKKSKTYPKFETTKEEYDIHIKNLSLASIRWLRREYDNANRQERKRLAKVYKEIKSQHKRIPVLKRLIWSKLYILFTLKWITKR